jgi:dolichol kinase
LLTTYGFSVLGEKAALAATIAFFAAAIVILASLAGFAHALASPKDQNI